MNAPATEIAVAPARSDERAVWAAFLSASPQATFYHELAFSDLYARKVDAVVNLLFRDKTGILALLPGGIVSGADGARELRSPFSASFAGVAAVPGLALEQALAVVAALEEWAAGERIGRIVIQQPPAVYIKPLDETLEFALRRSGFEQIGTELSYYLDSLNGMSPVAERNVRKGETAGCRLAETSDHDGVWEFLSVIKAERGQPFDLQRQDLLALRDAFGDRVLAFEVTVDGVRVAAMLAYGLNRHVLMGFNWAARADAQHVRPTDFLIHAVARWAFDRGFTTFDLGTTTLGGEPVWGVTRFKEKFGPRGTLRRRFAKVCG